MNTTDGFIYMSSRSLPNINTRKHTQKNEPTKELANERSSQRQNERTNERTYEEEKDKRKIACVCLFNACLDYIPNLFTENSIF